MVYETSQGTGSIILRIEMYYINDSMCQLTSCFYKRNILGGILGGVTEAIATSNS